MTATARTRVGLLIGPEGGFSTVEQNAAQAAGAVLFGWGERVLRADTASIVLTALVLYEAERQWL
jgi:16S rRNA (uracil1498-N3)-methyltransferase